MTKARQPQDVYEDELNQIIQDDFYWLASSKAIYRALDGIQFILDEYVKVNN